MDGFGWDCPFGGGGEHGGVGVLGGAAGCVYPNFELKRVATVAVLPLSVFLHAGIYGG